MRIRGVAAAASVALLIASCGSGAEDSGPDDDVQAGAEVTDEDAGTDSAAVPDDEDADAGAEAPDDPADGPDDPVAEGADSADYGLDDDITMLGIGDTAPVEWDSGISFEVTLNDFVATESLDLADFDGTDFGQGSDSYLVDLAEAGEPELETFFVADVTLHNTGPAVSLGDLASSLAVTDNADASPWSIWFAEGQDGTLDTTLETGDTYSGRLVGDTYAGDHYILRFETLPDTVWVVPAAQ